MCLICEVRVIWLFHLGKIGWLLKFEEYWSYGEIYREWDTIGPEGYSNGC